MIDPNKYEAALRLEAAGRLDEQRQGALDRLRAAGQVPDLAPWEPTHPHILAAEQKYGLPKGTLSALSMVESSGDPEARSPTNVRGLFQITQATGAPYGITATNRTNPYLNTDAAARLFKDLMAKGGGVEGALKLYKGNGPTDLSDDEYIGRFSKFFQQYAGVPVSQATAGLTTTPNASTIQPAIGTTSTPTTETFGQETRRRAGFGPRDEPATGIIASAGQYFDETPVAAFLRVLGIPGALVGTAASRVTGSPQVGSAAQFATDVATGGGLLERGGRTLGGVRKLVTPRGRAATELAGVRRLVTQAEERAGMLAGAGERAAAEAERLRGVRLPAQVERATQGAREVAQSAGEELARQGAAAPIPRRLTRRLDELEANPSGRTPGTPARTEVSPIVDANGRPIVRETPATPGRRLRSITERDVPPDLAAARQAVQQMGSRVSDFQRIVERVSAPGGSTKTKLQLLEESSNIIRRDIPGLEDAVATRLAIEELIANAGKLKEAAKAAGESGAPYAARAAELEKFLASPHVGRWLLQKGLTLTKYGAGGGLAIEAYRRLKKDE